jgi:hypothetical protein
LPEPRHTHIIGSVGFEPDDESGGLEAHNHVGEG